MPRPARISVADGCYHVLNRGNGKHEVFHKPEDYEAFLRLISDACERDEIIDCDGYFYIDGRRLPYLKCHAAHGPLDLPTSLAKSCNIYVQTLIRRDACFASFVRTGLRLVLGDSQRAERGSTDPGGNPGREFAAGDGSG